MTIYQFKINLIYATNYYSFELKCDYYLYTFKQINIFPGALFQFLS